jgi:hypothetical protein
MKEFFFDTDDDGHWYLIDASKRSEWANWIGSEEYQDGVEPEYAERIGCHPSWFTFQNPKATMS